MIKGKSIFCLLFIYLLYAGTGLLYAQIPHHGFLEMEGTCISHPFENSRDTLSDKEIIELQDNNGMPVWFGRQFYKDVCMTGQCKMIKLWLFWGGAGDYLGYEVEKNEPLTKSDHTEFNWEDYEKLHSILQDTTSVLKKLNPEDLTVETITEDFFKRYQIDGYTAATPPDLEGSVVKGAVYTCYTLWHTVYGETQSKIWEFLESRVNSEMLKKYFDSNKPSYISWAIKSIEKHPEFNDQFIRSIITLIGSGNDQLSDKALAYLKPGIMENPDVQKQLIGILGEADPYRQSTILWKFSEAGKIDNDVVLALLDLYEKQKIGVGSLNLIYRVIRPWHLNDSRTVAIIKRLSGHENAYVRNITNRLLQSMSGEKRSGN